MVSIKLQGSPVRLRMPYETKNARWLDAGTYIGVSPSKLDEMVDDDGMPLAKLINSRKVCNWAVSQFEMQKA